MKGVLLAIGLSLPASAAAATHLLIVSGIGGEAHYEDLFHRWSMQLLQTADSLSLPAERVQYLAHQPERSADKIDAIAVKEAVKENVADAIADIGNRAADDDLVVLVLIGHGTADKRGAQFNLPGPDLSADELADLLKPLSRQMVAVVNTTAASGPFTKALSGERRVIITATETARENNHTVFAQYFIAGLRDDAADTDKDGRASLLEAFQYAKREVLREYDSDQRLLTEHATLDDNGDGIASLEPSAQGANIASSDSQSSAEDATTNGDGILAASVHIARPKLDFDTTDAATTEALDELLSRAEQLQADIATLKQEKAELNEDVYQARLEELLVELALNRRQIRALREEQ